MKEKIKQRKGFIQIPLLIGIILFVAVASGAGYGAIEYKRASNLLKEAGELTKEEKYTEAKEKLELVQNSWLVKNLGVKKQEIISKIEENKKLEEDKSKYNQGIDELDKDQLEEAISILSELPGNSFYYQKAQTKIEESKKKMLEGELSEEKIAKEEAEEKTRQETTAKKVAEAKAKQEEIIRKAREGDLAAKEAEERMMNADNDGDGLTYREELAKGTYDYNTDSDGDGIPDGEDLHPAGGGRYDAQYFSWKYDYDKTSWEWKYSIHEDWYAYYKNKPRLPHGAVYVTYNDDAIKAIAKQLKDNAVSKNYHIVSFTIFFIQGLPYVEDYYTGYDEYPKYPVETLIDRNGDCEDLSYLAASIIGAMNYDVVLVELPGNPGHMAIAIKIAPEQSGTYYNLDGDRYYYFETTAEGWKLGDIPDEFRYTPATLIRIPSGEIINNVNPQYKKPCFVSPDFSGYYTDGKNYYLDGQCYNLVYCLPYKGYYVNPQVTTELYWDSSCSQTVTLGCFKSTDYPGYFYNKSYDFFYDSKCIQKAKLCRSSPNYSDTYYDGYNEYWDSSCTQKVVLWCPKSTYYPGYFFNNYDREIYIDSQCVQKATICRVSPIYSDRYWDGEYNYWDSSCTQKVVSWCSKSIYYPGYFFNSIDGEIYIDYQCTQLKE